LKNGFWMAFQVFRHCPDGAGRIGELFQCHIELVAERAVLVRDAGVGIECLSGAFQRLGTLL